MEKNGFKVIAHPAIRMFVFCFLGPIKKLQQKERLRFEMKVEFYWTILFFFCFKIARCFARFHFQYAG